MCFLSSGEVTSETAKRFGSYGVKRGDDGDDTGGGAKIGHHLTKMGEFFFFRAIDPPPIPTALKYSYDAMDQFEAQFDDICALYSPLHVEDRLSVGGEEDIDRGYPCGDQF